MFSHAMQYFDACQVSWYEHALTKSAIQGVLWIFLHIPLTFALFQIGLFLNEFGNIMLARHDVSKPLFQYFSISLAAYTMLLTAIKATNMDITELLS